MNLSSLKMFCDVVEEGSFTQAAQKGFVTQPAVTKQIHQLEDLYGAELFDRTDKRLILTEAGKALYPYAKEIVANFQGSIETVKAITGNAEKKLHVGASLTIGDYILPDLLERFMNKKESIKFQLSLSNTPDILAKLQSYEIDIALVEGILERDKKARDIIVEKFAEDELILVTPNNDRWEGITEIGIREMIQEKMIWREPSSGTRALVEEALKDKGVLEEIRGSMEIGSLQAIKSAVRAGLGMSIVPKLTAVTELKFGLLKEVKVKDLRITRSLYIVKKKTRFRKPLIDEFSHFIKHEDIL
ncbi:LysR family transcriptional regulator [Pullulanibacillus sp. KACC 23026]|nr:LysR family transcriptional regulator [Pullulanibacillus sp. KACC 23026]WEG15024.1 LysR family transcriptional regulator [Pullulanibacillus sp. KACC 23026]